MKPEEACEATARFDGGDVQYVECAESADLALNFPEWTWQLTRLQRGDFRAHAVAIPLDAVLIARLNFNRALLHRVRPPPACFSLLLFAESAGAVFVEGHKLSAGDCVAPHPESDVEIVSHGESTIVAISISEIIWGRKGQWPQGEGIELRGGGHLLACHRESVVALLNAADSAIQALAVHSRPLTSQDTRHFFSELMLARLSDARTQAQPRYVHEERPERARRRIGVERARAYILDHLTDPIRLSDLCRHTHLQARSLEYGFREIVGLSPVRYIKMMRLGEVRRHLLSRVNEYRSISELALDSGFWHLSQFAVDYKKLFMESPSATRQRAAGKAHRPLLKTQGDTNVTMSSIGATAHAADRETRMGWTQFTTVASPGTG
jgi:AraC family ethanolamine operon transcriptional activator